jgi:hypothetical protein
VDWYNHQYHQSGDGEIICQNELVFKQARLTNPKRWSK